MNPTLKAIKDACDEVGDCWLWKQGVNSGGHPQARFAGKTWLVRRFVFTQLLGRTTAKSSAAGVRCLQPLCVSPACLEERTRREVVQLTYESGGRTPASEYFARRRRALAQGLGKLDMDKAREIRARYIAGASMRGLGKEYGVCRSTIANIVTNRSWREAEANVFDLAALSPTRPVKNLDAMYRASRRVLREFNPDIADQVEAA